MLPTSGNIRFNQMKNLSLNGQKGTAVIVKQCCRYV